MLLDLQGLKIALNGISTKIDSKVSKNQLPKPDWNESNPSHKNFIQNKTHGETIKDNYLVKNQNFSKLFYDGYFFDNPIELDLNKTYTVKYDDIPYILTPFVDPYGDYRLGNESLFRYDTFGDKNSENYIPFVLGNYQLYIDDINAHTIEIILNDENPQIVLEKTQLWFDVASFSDPLFNYCTYKIEYDGKIYDNLTLSEDNPNLITDDFILEVNPNAYSFFDVYTLTADLHTFKLYQDEEIIIDTFIGFPASMRLYTLLPFEPQETYYNVIWDNQSYEVKVKSSPYDSDDFYLGNWFFCDGDKSYDTGEPFLIIFDSNEILIAGKDNNINVSVCERQVEVQQLDPKFIPGALGVVDYIGSVSFGTGKTGGAYSFAAGYETRASGDYSFAVGNYTSAGPYACAEGTNTKAAYCSHAEGYYTEATGGYAHAEGSETKASGMYSHAEGKTTEASGMFSHAEGNFTTADNQAAHAEGCSTVAEGAYSHAEGFSSTASGNSSHAEGFSTLAEKDYSHAEGYRTEATGKYAHAEGAVTVASGMYSHAEGNGSKATGDSSHAEGGATEAMGEDSHAEGYNTVATGSSQHVQGEWNVPDQNTSTPARTLHAHIVGNGTGTDARSNAHTLDWDGNAWFAGDVYVGSASGVNKDSGSKKLATEEFVNNKGYLTSFTETDPTVPTWAKAPTKPTYTASEVGALPADTIIPTVPTKVSAFTNDAGYALKSELGNFLPEVTSSNNGQILRVIDGVWAATLLPNAEDGKF